MRPWGGSSEAGTLALTLRLHKLGNRRRMKGIAPSHTRRGPHAHAPRLRCVRHSSIEKPDYPEFSYSPWLLLPDPTPNAPPLSLLKGTANAGASQTSLTNAPLAGSSQSPRGNAVHKRGAAHIAVKTGRSPRRTPQFASNLLRASPHITTSPRSCRSAMTTSPESASTAASRDLANASQARSPCPRSLRR